jgi:type VI secretion system protein
MGLRLEVVSQQRKSLGGRAAKRFGPDGGSIGRSLDCDWCLPDHKRILSGCHACIDFRSGSYYIVDTSTNGVFVNDAPEPVGKGKPQRLFTGDHVFIGDYELLAHIDAVPGRSDTLIDDDHVDPVDTMQQVEAPETSHHDLVDVLEMTGIGLKMVLADDASGTLRALRDASRAEADGPRAEAMLTTDTARQKRWTAANDAHPPGEDTAAARAVGSNTKSRAGPIESNTESRAGAVQPDTRLPAAAIGSPTDLQAHARGSDALGASIAPGPASDLFAAFCEGAGLKPFPIDADRAYDTFFHLGEAMQAMAGGLMSSLRLRAVQKARLRQSVTAIQPRLNNPLKFCSNPRNALEMLLSRTGKEFLDPTTAINDAFRDVNLHQSILVSVLPKVLDRYVGQLDPDVLEERFSNSQRNRLLGAANKLKYWDLYRDLVHQASDELPEAFLDALADAYESEVRASHSRERAASALAKSAGPLTAG